MISPTFPSVKLHNVAFGTLCRTLLPGLAAALSCETGVTPKSVSFRLSIQRVKKDLVYEIITNDLRRAEILSSIYAVSH